MKDYSQTGEQAVILDLLSDQPTGTVLDIGASDGVTFSNSRALLESGWGGTLIEPEPRAFLKLFELYRDRPDVHLVNCAVGESFYMSRFWVTEDLVSTTDERHFTKWSRHARYEGCYHVAVVPIDRFLIRPVATFVNIDVEGRSAELALRALRHEQGGAPLVWCIEHDDRLRELTVAGAEHGYQVVFTNAENVIMVR